MDVEYLQTRNPFEVDEQTNTLNPFDLVTRSSSTPQTCYTEEVDLANIQSCMTPQLLDGITLYPEDVRSISANSHDAVHGTQLPTTSLDSRTSFTCKMISAGGLVCNMDIPVQMLTSHLSSAHPTLNHTGDLSEQKESNCSWYGCICPPQGRRKARCGGRLDGHAAHVADLVDHIEKVHLRMLYSCDMCGRATWTSKSALDRHRNGRPAGKDKELRPCQGKVPCVCRVCFRSFPSEVDLEGHLDDGKCPGPA
jgi:hypothetical protein